MSTIETNLNKNQFSATKLKMPRKSKNGSRITRKILRTPADVFLNFHQKLFSTSKFEF